MKKISPILFFAIIAMLLSGCALNRMVKKHDTVKYEAKPKVLEVHGGNVKVEVSGTFPARYFGRRVNVDIQPIVKYEGGQVPLKKIKVVGERVVEGEGTIIKRREGGSFTFQDQFVYLPQMMVSELIIDVKASKGNKTVTLGEQIKIADGIIMTPQRIAMDEKVEIAAHGYERVVVLTQRANLFFDYNSSNLSMNQKLNKQQANIDAINTMRTFVEQGLEIKDVQVNAWASPEGELSINAKLSEDRGKVGKKWFDDYMNSLDRIKAREMRVKVDEVKRPYTLNVNARGEDYDGFMAAIQASKIPEKQSIINVIRMQPNKTQREQEIKNMAVIYAEVEAILEPLRRAEIVVRCFEAKKTDAQIAELAITDPTKLDEKELLFAATLTEDKETKLRIYRTATTQFPNSWKGFNNAGAILLTMGQSDEAKSFIEKANALSPNNGQVLNNLGIIYLRKQDKKAQTYFDKAEQAGINVSYNNGILRIINGNYEEAHRLMRAYNCKYNLALVQLLLAKPADAVKTLNCLKVKTAQSYYLMAIIGARTENTSMMYDNLKKAFAIDAKYKAEAKKDREFLKFHNTSDFQNAVK